jgi:carbamoyl-phosphate synthase large subunit
MKKNILVTGAGALLGQGILRLLQIADFSKKIFTADPDARSTGHWLGDHAIIVPKATDSSFIDAIKKIVVDHKIDAILVGTDVELPIFAKFKDYFQTSFNCKVLVSNEEVVTIANDKFLTADFLKNNNFPYPFSVMANSMDNLKEIETKLGFPLFAKPFDGARSLGIKKIENHEELIEIYSPDSNLVVQQFLSENEGEYTSGCTVVDGKCKAIVTLKRDLRDGNTYRTYRNSETTIYDDQIRLIAEKLNPDGAVNFQFRISNGKPVIFEINGRFSGTTPLRHFYGYNEVEALLKFYLFGEEIKTPDLKNGVVMRTWSDLFVEEKELETLLNEQELENLHPTYFNFSLKN